MAVISTSKSTQEARSTKLEEALRESVLDDQELKKALLTAFSSGKTEFLISPIAAATGITKHTLSSDLPCLHKIFEEVRNKVDVPVIGLSVSLTTWFPTQFDSNGKGIHASDFEFHMEEPTLARKVGNFLRGYKRVI